MNSTSPSRNPRVRCGLLALALCLGGCSLAHNGPMEGTETGNPPLIDSTLLTLVVSSDEVHITGDPGAVSPGGTPLEIVSSFSGDAFHGTAAADGSFDIAVSDAPLDTFEVRAVSGDTSSNAVYVARGASAVTSGSSHALTCDQRTMLASSQLNAVAKSADTSCTIDLECWMDSSGSSCTHHCSTYALSTQGQADLQAARDAINGGVCKDFAADDCTVIEPPCEAPGYPSCVAGTCQLVPETQGKDLACSADPDCSGFTGATCDDATQVCVYPDGSQVQALPACTWPDTFEHGKPYLETCSVAHALVGCLDSDHRGGSGCYLSDDPNHCSFSPASTLGQTCRDQCKANEYAIGCGPMAPTPDLPAGCVKQRRIGGSLQADELGTYYCCPCQ